MSNIIREIEYKNDAGAVQSAKIAPLAEDIKVSAAAGAKNIMEYATQEAVMAKDTANTYTDQKITALVGGAPEALDTLKEISDKLADNDDAVAAIVSTVSGKVDKVSGKQLSTNDYTTAEKTKLAGIAAGANNYTHPSTHAASVITQDSAHRFVTDTEKTTWNGKAAGLHSHGIPDVSGLEAALNKKTAVVVASSMPSDAANGTVCFKIVTV